MKIAIESATKSDTQEIAAFIRKVFDQAVAPQYSRKGKQEFYKYIKEQALSDRLNSIHWILKAVDGGKLVGVIEIRENKHVSLLFVETKMQRKGIGRKLLTQAIDKLKTRNPNQAVLSVHSSPNAIRAYEKLQFTPIGSEQAVNGIRFITMEKQL